MTSAKESNMNDILKSSRLLVPARYDVNETIDKLQIRRLASRELVTRIQIKLKNNLSKHKYLATDESGSQYILKQASTLEKSSNDEISYILQSREIVVDDGLLLLKTPKYEMPRTTKARDAKLFFLQTRESWKGGIQYQREECDASGLIHREGLRQPQVGALHAIASFWTISDQPAAIVMPTGTGKTEVMIASAIDAACERLLVVVPTDSLRTQTADKFLTYGKLEQLGVISGLPWPVVATLSTQPKPKHLDLLKNCNITVTTMSAIGRMNSDEQLEFSRLFSHIYFDEAHHIEAQTWKRFQQNCRDAKVLLLTATPFREDGKHLEGKIIYNFPLRKAQEQGYFQRISFFDVFEPDEDMADRAIASRAVECLKTDLKSGRNHILMARAKTIEEAEKIYRNIYLPLYPDLSPVLIHSRLSNRNSLLTDIREGRHQIIVCVDMFGEGFDLPSLKIAALHSVHKSLGITLQFIGRFARTSSDVGGASFVANVADDGVSEALESLYLEDADWNQILPDMSHDAIDPQAKLSDLLDSLRPLKAQTSDSVEISPFALRPKLTTQVFKTSLFSPRNFKEAFKQRHEITQALVSKDEHLLIIIARQKNSLEWTNSKDILIDVWGLYLAYFDPKLNLLYIHSSSGGSTLELAKAVSTEPSLIRNEEIFRVFSGMKRLTLFNIGLSGRNRNIRFQMFAGLDVREAVDPVQQQSKFKTNVTGVGFENGKKSNIGCSRKGKIWSMSSGSLVDWRNWCDRMGFKLSNKKSDPNDFLKFTLIPTVVSSLPSSSIPLMADWPDQLFEAERFFFEITSSTNRYAFDDCAVELESWRADAKSFHFGVLLGTDAKAVLRLYLDDHQYFSVEQISGPALEISTFGQKQDIAAFFNSHPPIIRLADGSQLSGNVLFSPQTELVETYDRSLIRSIDWSGVDLAKESLWKDGIRRSNSVQERFIEHLKQEGQSSFIVDDDDTGESADILEIIEDAERVLVNFWHCKYSSSDSPGNRVRDLYEVCGQATKSVKWTYSLTRLINHLIIRETKGKNGRDTRFHVGTSKELAVLKKASRRKFTEYRIGIVQPGLSKGNIPNEHLAILGATSSFVSSVTDRPLIVVSSD